MIFKLLICIIILISSAVRAEHVTRDFRVFTGGWINYTATSDDYKINDYPDVGMYGSIVSGNTSVQGLMFYDPVIKKGRPGYLYISQSLPFRTHSMTLQAGLIRSDWGFWTKSLINPSTSPNLLNGDAIYHVGFDNDLFQGVGISSIVEHRKFKMTLFAGGNYTSDKSGFVEETYIQDVDLNTEFGSNVYGLFEYSLSPGEFIKFGMLVGNLSKEIDFDLERYIVGYKYERNNWIFTAEYQEMHFDSHVEFNNEIPGISEHIKFKDTFVYLGYNFPKYRIYSTASVSDRPEKMSEYVIKSHMVNTINSSSSPGVINTNRWDLLHEEKNRSTTISLGVDYELTDNLNIRAEGSYIHSSGGKRLFNTRNDEIRDKNTTYFGFGITKTF